MPPPVFRAEIVSADRSDDTINVGVRFTADGVSVAQRVFNFHVPITRQEARAQIDAAGQRLKDALAGQTDFSGWVGQGWTI